MFFLFFLLLWLSSSDVPFMFTISYILLDFLQCNVSNVRFNAYVF